MALLHPPCFWHCLGVGAVGLDCPDVMVVFERILAQPCTSMRAQRDSDYPDTAPWWLKPTLRGRIAVR